MFDNIRFCPKPRQDCARDASASSAYEQLTDRRNIVVIADEAHRTQYGFEASIKEVKDKETKENISTLFAGYCTEMEGAAIAQTAHLNEVPFVVLRAISDKADDSASMDYPTFEKQAVAHSVRLVCGMMKNLAAKEA